MKSKAMTVGCGELEHEVAQRADGDLLGNVAGARQRSIPDGANPLRCAAEAISLSMQVVRLHAESLASGDLDVRSAPVFLGKGIAQVAAQRGVSATIS